MLKSIVAVVVPILVWGVLWVGIGAGLAAVMADSFSEGVPQTGGLLVAFIVISSLLSATAGFLCARLAPANPMKHVWILAVVQLLIGVGVQTGAWNLMPIWYHLLFLALVVPMHLVGGKLADNRHRLPTAGASVST